LITHNEFRGSLGILAVGLLIITILVIITLFILEGAAASA
jgi:hypothetical protein